MATPLLDAARDLRALFDADASTPGPTLADETVEALVAAGLHATMAPRDLGGAELPAGEVIDVFAEVARADGSVGWCLMAYAATAAIFGSHLDDEAVSAMFADGVPLAAGQLAPNGSAAPIEGGWRISGAYQFGSGVAHAEWIGVGALTVPSDPTANPDYIIAALPASAVDLDGNWDVLGLCHTASWDYTVRDATVAAGAAFDFFGDLPRRGGGLYRIGVLALAAIGHAGWAIGVTRRALDELVSVATSKHRMGAPTPLRDSESFLGALGTLESRWRAAACWTRDAFERAEHRANEHGVADPVDVIACRQATAHLNQEAADIVRRAYLLAGTTALRDGPLQRCFRDSHAGSQHFVAGPAATLDFARDLLARAPAGPLDP